MPSSTDKSTGRQDVAAYMRDGVNGLSLVGGLSVAVARLSTQDARSLTTRAGIATALAEIRVRHPPPQDTRLRLMITVATPVEAVKAFDLIQVVLQRDPLAGLLRERWPVREPGAFREPIIEISGREGVPTESIEAWEILTTIAVACRIQPRRIKSARALALAAARTLRTLKGRQKEAVKAIAAIARAQALNPEAAAIAFAHAPRERGAVAVTVVGATEAGVWRSSAKTGIRPIAARPWHRDPLVADAMLTIAKASIARCAPYQITATDGQIWTQALLSQTGHGFDAYIQRPSGCVEHVEVVGRCAWASLGAEAAAQLASISGRPVEVPGRDWLTEPSVDADGDGAQSPLHALAAAGIVTEAQLRQFRFRLEGAVRRTRDAAILAFLAGLPPATAELARLIEPVTAYDAKTNRRFALGRKHVDAAVAAAVHRDPAAMVRAVEASSTRALVLAAALVGPWEVASEAVASGQPPREALRLFASAAIDRPLSRAAALSLAACRT